MQSYFKNLKKIEALNDVPGRKIAIVYPWRKNRCPYLLEAGLVGDLCGWKCESSCHQ